MKIYTRIEIDMKSGETLREESFEWEGEIAWCGGGGSGGGGGGSGRVDYPEYMKEIQADWLGGANYDSPSNMTDLSAGNDITSLMDAAIGNSPFAGLSAYDPSSRITKMEDGVERYRQYINDMSTTDKVEAELAKFDGGMRDINAVNSSAFVIGRQIVASGLIEAKLQAEQSLANLTVEMNRVAIVAKSEQVNTDRKIDEQDALWDLEVFQIGGNVLAGIGGGTIQKKGEQPSQIQSAIGGALSGAAAGAAIGSAVPGVGTAIGAGVGAALGGGSAFL